MKEVYKKLNNFYNFDFNKYLKDPIKRIQGKKQII
jgi:hypothetical protein